MDELKLAITFSEDTLEWIDNQIGSGRFVSRSHAVNYCVKEIMVQERTSKVKVRGPGPNQDISF